MFFVEDQKDHRVRKTIKNQVLQTGIWYLEKHEVWVTAGADFNIRVWKIPRFSNDDNEEECTEEKKDEKMESDESEDNNEIEKKKEEEKVQLDKKNKDKKGSIDRKKKEKEETKDKKLMEKKAKEKKSKEKKNKEEERKEKNSKVLWWTFEAHLKEITDVIEIIENQKPKMIVTCSLDGKIKLFSLMDLCYLSELKDPSHSSRGVKGLTCSDACEGNIMLSYGFVNHINV